MSVSEPPADASVIQPVPVGSTVELLLNPRRVLLAVFLFCATAEFALFLLDWHVNYGRMVDASPVRNLFNTTREDGLASWFGVTQTAFVALTLWMLFVTVRASGEKRWVVIGWLVLALFFSYMAFDDGSEFHERMGSTFKIMQERAAENSTGDLVTDIFPSYPWQVIFLPVFGAMGLFILVFLWRQLGTHASRLLVVAGIGCFVIAVGIDFVEGLDEGHPLNLNAMIGEIPAVENYTINRFDRTGYRAVRHFGKSLEETIEMFGMTLLWIAFLGHWMRLTRQLRVSFETR